VTQHLDQAISLFKNQGALESMGERVREAAFAEVCFEHRRILPYGRLP
jgi:hypothetical protein